MRGEQGRRLTGRLAADYADKRGKDELGTWNFVLCSWFLLPVLKIEEAAQKQVKEQSTKNKVHLFRVICG